MTWQGQGQPPSSADALRTSTWIRQQISGSQQALDEQALLRAAFAVNVLSTGGQQARPIGLIW